MLLAILIAWSILPGVLWLVLVYRQDRYEPEPIGQIIKIYVLGAFAVVPAAFVEQFVAVLLPGAGAAQAMTLTELILAGPIEEFFKLAVVLVFIFRHRDFNEPLDGIIYASTAALGFASAENIVYALSYGQNVILIRAVLSVPFHFLVAGFYGFALGMRLTENPRKAGVFTGWLLAAAFHGGGNALIFAGSTLASPILFVLDFGLLFLLVKIYRSQVRDLLAVSPFRPEGVVPRSDSSRTSCD